MAIDINQIQQAVDAAQAQIPDLEKELLRAKAAGLDTQDFTDRLNKLKQQVQALKTYYLK